MNEICPTSLLAPSPCPATPHTPKGVVVRQMQRPTCHTLPHLVVGQWGKAPCPPVCTDGTNQMNTLPESVLALIAMGWPAGDSAPRLPRLLYRPDDGVNRTLCGLRYVDVRSLVDDGVLVNEWRGGGAGIAILAGDLEALRDFCSAQARAGVVGNVRAA
jgi:hypothetical protein